MTPKSKEELKEQLAAIEHERWADWQKYLFSKCSVRNGGDYIIDNELVNHWWKQIETPYPELSDKEKDADREQVDRYWQLITSYHQQQLEQAVREARLGELKAVKHFVDGKYGKPINISGDAQIVIKKAMDGFIYISNRIAELQSTKEDKSNE